MAFMMVELVRGGWLPVGNGNHHSFYCELWDYKCISMSSFIYLCLCYRARVFFFCPPILSVSKSWNSLTGYAQKYVQIYVLFIEYPCVTKGLGTVNWSTEYQKGLIQLRVGPLQQARQPCFTDWTIYSPKTCMLLVQTFPFAINHKTCIVMKFH